jgi:hypothetical protein
MRISRFVAESNTHAVLPSVTMAVGLPPTATRRPTSRGQASISPFAMPTSRDSMIW